MTNIADAMFIGTLFIVSALATFNLAILTVENWQNRREERRFRAEQEKRRRLRLEGREAEL